MKEMIYKMLRERELLEKGEYLGFEYFIMNLGTHPTAYIKIPENHKFYQKYYDDIYIDCHGGLTYSEEFLWISETEKLEGWFIGWDYAHYGDYIESILGPLYSNVTDEKKWTTEEIKEECISVCKILKEVN